MHGHIMRAGFFPRALNLTDDQKTQMKAIMEKERPTMKPLFQQERQIDQQLRQYVEGTYDESQSSRPGRTEVAARSRTHGGPHPHSQRDVPVADHRPANRSSRRSRRTTRPACKNTCTKPRPLPSNSREKRQAFRFTKKRLGFRSRRSVEVSFHGRSGKGPASNRAATAESNLGSYGLTKIKIRRELRFAEN